MSRDATQPPLDDPYETLGVPRTASLEQVRTAYWGLARQWHPDREGGDAARFAQVAAAYSVLSDPAQREQYDRTGSVDRSAVDQVATRMAQVLSQMFAALMNQVASAGRPLASYNYVESLGELVGRNLVELTRRDGELSRDIASREQLLPRISREGSQPNLFEEVLQNQLREMTKVWEDNRLTLAGLRRAQEELAHYTDEVEFFQAVVTMSSGPGGPFGAHVNGSNVGSWFASTAHWTAPTDMDEDDYEETDVDEDFSPSVGSQREE